MPAEAPLKVTEHYLCEEGEGSTLGALTYLVRLSGCNLRCWWCDSKQSSFYNDEEKLVPAAAIARAALKSPARWVSFTGGEPTWREPAELKALGALCRRLRRAGRKVKIESNGLLLPAELKGAADLWSVAPKWDGAKKAATPAMRFDATMLRRFLKLPLQLKFVVTFTPDGQPRASDLAWAAGLLRGLKAARLPPAYFIPEAYAKGDYLERCRRLGSAVEALAPKLKGWDLHVQPQWHRVLYGDERGR